jgi:hypothetical protein
VVVHAEHHPPRSQHDAERQADREEGERGELETEARQQPDDGGGADSETERPDPDEECVRDHARRR